MLEHLDLRLDQDFHSYLDFLSGISLQDPQYQILKIRLIDIYNDSNTKAKECYRSNDHQNALKYFLKIYEIHKRFSRIIYESDSSTKEGNYIFNVILNIAECHFQINNLKESLKFYCAHCTMILLSSKLATYKISDYQDLITKIDKILLISQTLKDQKTFDEFTELKTEFLQEINWMDYLDKINGHLRFSSLNFSFKNHKLASKHLDNALQIYSKINAKNICNTTLKNLSIGDLFYKYQFFGNAIEIYFEGYSRLKKIYDNTGNDNTELRDQIVVYLFRIAECQLNLKDIKNTKFTIDFISVLDKNNHELKLLIDRLNEIQLSSNLISVNPMQNLSQNAFSEIDRELPVVQSFETKINQFVLSSSQIPEIRFSLPNRFNLKLSDLFIDFQIPRDEISLIETDQFQIDDYQPESFTAQLGFITAKTDNDPRIEDLDSQIFDNSQRTSTLNSPDKFEISASLGILNTSSISSPNEESVQGSFIAFIPHEDRPSPISTAQPKFDGNRSQSLLRAGCSNKCIIS